MLFWPLILFLNFDLFVDKAGKMDIRQLVKKKHFW